MTEEKGKMEGMGGRRGRGDMSKSKLAEREGEMAGNQERSILIQNLV